MASAKKVLALRHSRGGGNRDNPLTDAFLGGKDGSGGEDDTQLRNRDP